jgi:natural product precursor
MKLKLRKVTAKELSESELNKVQGGFLNIYRSNRLGHYTLTYDKCPTCASVYTRTS